MAKEITFKIVADANQAASEAKSLKQQLREATKEAQNLIAAGQENTEAYRKARNEVAQLQDKLRDFNDELKALDPGQKFQTIAGIASGVAGGFQAAQGAMALFGAESKEVEKALLKVQAATALAQGIDQVRELGKYFNLAKTAIMGGVQSMGKLRAALVATGVGAFAVAIGTIVANWEELTKWIDKTFPKLGGVANMFDNIKKVAMGSLKVLIEYFKSLGEMMVQLWTGEWGNLVDTAKGLGSRLSKAYTEGYIEEEQEQSKEREAALLESQKKTHERQLKLMEAQGKDTYAFKKKMLEDELKLVEMQKGKESDEYKDAYLNLQLLEIDHQKKISDIRKAAEDKATAAYFEKLNAEYTRQQGLLKIQEDYANLNKEKEEAVVSNIQKAAHQKIEIASFDAAKQKEIRDKRISEELAAEQALVNAKLQLATDSVNLISNVGNILIQDQKKLEKFNKASALVQIGIDTAKALSSALATANAPTADNVASGGLAGIAKYIALAGTITANALRAKQILQSGGSSGSAPTLGGAASVPKIGGGTPATAAPDLGGSAGVISTQRISNQTGKDANEAGQFKIYVTETDITSTQERVGQIKQKAKVF